MRDEHADRVERARRGRRADTTVWALHGRRGDPGHGRDRDPIVAHVTEAERSYARQLGVRYTPTQFAAPGGQQAMRADLLGALRAAHGPPPEAWKWTPRYAARRIAWHVLDHAWEIEDKST